MLRGEGGGPLEGDHWPFREKKKGTRGGGGGERGCENKKISWAAILFYCTILRSSCSINVSLRLDTLEFSVDSILLSLSLVIIIFTSGRRGDNERV